MRPEAEGASAEGARKLIRLLLVDDHEVVREGLRGLLGRDPRYEVAGVAGTGAEAVRAAAALRPDVVLLDLRLPDLRGEEVCRAIREASPRSAILVLTTDPREEAVRASAESGAHAYVTKSAGLKELRSVLEGVAAQRLDPTSGAGNEQILTHLRGVIAQSRDDGEPGGVTPQQQRVLELAAQGLTNKEIGARLYITESTVRFHIQNLKARLGAQTKTEVVVRALERGLISDRDEM